MKKLSIKGTTFIEIISSTVILLFLCQISFSLLVIQKNFYEDNYFLGEQKRQLQFAQTYLKRDFYESVSARKFGDNILELRSYSGKIISYYLAYDPYGEESWKQQSKKTLYRKISGENAQPITQYCGEFFVKEEYHNDYIKVEATLFGGSKYITVEEYYEKK